MEISHNKREGSKGTLQSHAWKDAFVRRRGSPMRAMNGKQWISVKISRKCLFLYCVESPKDKNVTIESLQIQHNLKVGSGNWILELQRPYMLMLHSQKTCVAAAFQNATVCWYWYAEAHSNKVMVLECGHMWEYFSSSFSFSLCLSSLIFPLSPSLSPSFPHVSLFLWNLKFKTGKAICLTCCWPWG